MSTIAFIGLGIMGRPMAAHLVAAGHDVVGYNRSPAAVERHVQAGGRGATSVAEAVRDADVIITMVPDGPDVEQVTLGEQGIFATGCPGALYIDCSTIRPDIARAVAQEGARAGFAVVDAPVSGGEAGAVEATLSVMVGGEPDAVAAAMEFLQVVGGTVVHVGGPGAGQTVKAANQLIVAGTIGLVAEAIVLLQAHGVEPGPAVEVLAGGLAGNRILDRKAPAMLAREFAPGFRIDLHHKDMGIVVAAAREAGVAIPLGATAAQLVGSTRAQGWGGLDHSALLLLIERLSGREPNGADGDPGPS